ncbi:hypothetical protein WME89_00620 [Sorangium sp. So ce321]|uniref:hypothetical protein n=1 Tax=Sorangium sp. So ce321 TaxID=3133300 RepID=UPI003F606E34
MKKLFASLALSFVSMVVAGCMSGVDDGEVEGGQVAGEESTLNESAGDENVGEAADAIMRDAWNGSCAETLSLRTAPNGGYACGYPIYYGTLLWVYSVHDSWAYVYVGSSSGCAGMYGYVLKDYVSRSCIP